MVDLRLGGVRHQLLSLGMQPGVLLKPDVFLRLAAVATQAASDPALANDEAVRAAIAELSGRVIDHNMKWIEQAAGAVAAKRGTHASWALANEVAGLRRTSGVISELGILMDGAIVAAMVSRRPEVAGAAKRAFAVVLSTWRITADYLSSFFSDFFSSFFGSFAVMSATISLTSFSVSSPFLKARLTFTSRLS